MSFSQDSHVNTNHHHEHVHRLYIYVKTLTGILWANIELSPLRQKFRLHIFWPAPDAAHNGARRRGSDASAGRGRCPHAVPRVLATRGDRARVLAFAALIGLGVYTHSAGPLPGLDLLKGKERPTPVMYALMGETQGSPQQLRSLQCYAKMARETGSELVVGPVKTRAVNGGEDEYVSFDAIVKPEPGTWRAMTKDDRAAFLTHNLDRGCITALREQDTIGTTFVSPGDETVRSIPSPRRRITSRWLTASRRGAESHRAWPPPCTPSARSRAPSSISGFEAHRASVQRGAQVSVRRRGQELPGGPREVQRGDDGACRFSSRSTRTRRPSTSTRSCTCAARPRRARPSHVRRHGRYERQHADEVAELRVQDDPLHPRVAEAGGLGDGGARPVHDG